MNQNIIRYESIRDLNAAARKGLAVVVFPPDSSNGVRITQLAIKHGFIHGKALTSGNWINVEFQPYSVR